MILMRTNTGFTLIEVLVTSLLLAVVAGVLVFVIGVYSSEINQGTAASRLQMEYDILSSQIGSAARVCQYVLAEGESRAPPLLTSPNVTKIRMVLASGIDTTSFRIQNGKVQDSTSAGWRYFTVGNDSLQTGPGSAFSLLPGRKGVALNLVLWRRNKSRSDTLRIVGDEYLCRN